MNQLEEHVDSLVGGRIDFEQDLFEQGMSSNSILQLIIKVKEKYGVDVDIEQFLERPTMQYLRELILAQDAQHGDDTSVNKVVQWPTYSVLEEIRGRLSRTDIDPNIDFFEQGLASFELMDLVVFAKDKYNVEIDIEAFFESPTLTHLTQIIKQESQLDLDKELEMEEVAEPKAEVSIMSSMEEKEAFKAKLYNIRKGLNTVCGTVIAPSDTNQFLQQYEYRKTFHEFSEQEVEAGTLIRWLSKLNAYLVDGKYRYQYPSAGGTYSVQTYIEIKEDKVEGLESGNYYFNPVQHSLQKVPSSKITRTSHFYYNRPYYDSAHFCLYFVLEYQGIEPIYKERSDLFGAVEVGAIMQLLSQSQAEYGMGTCPLSGVDESSIAEAFKLSESQRVLFGLIGGPVEEFANEKAPVSVALNKVEELVHPLSKQHDVHCASTHVKPVNTVINTAQQIQPTRPMLATMPLNEGQKGLWVVYSRHSDSSAYNCPIGYRIRGEFDLASLQLALNELLTQFPVLACTVAEQQGNPVFVHSARGVALIEIEDATEFDERSLLQLCESLIKKRFDLATQLPIRMHVLKLNPQEHLVLVCAHHIVSDGGSILPMIESLFSFYKQRVEQNGIVSPEPRLGWADFQEKEKARMSSDEYAKAMAYWQQVLADAPETSVPLNDYTRSDATAMVGKSLQLKLDSSLINAIRQMSKSKRVYTSSIILSAYNILVSKFSGQDDLVIGMPTDARASELLSQEIGYFVYTLPIRSKVTSEQPFTTFVKGVQKSILAGLTHALPFPHLARSFGSSESMDSFPIFQIAYAYQQTESVSMWPDLSNAMPEGVSATPLKNLGQKGEYELMLEVVDTPGEFILNLKYNPTLYKRQTIQRWLNVLNNILEQVTRQPEQNIHDIELWSDSDEPELLEEFNDTAVDLGEAMCIHQLFEGQVQRNPNANALIFDNYHLTYDMLNTKADQLAYCLQELGVEPGDLVGVCMSRSINMVVSLMGILKAGASYVPIEPSYPKQRLSYIVEDAQLSVLLTQHNHAALFDDFSGSLVCLDAGDETVQPQRLKPRQIDIKPQDGCYVIYTSGSTGNPKGCVLSHEAVVNRLRWMQTQYHLGSSDRILQKTPFSFDVSVWEFFWPLITGTCLVVAKPEGHKDPAYLVDVINKHQVTVCHFVPSMLSLFVESKKAMQCTSLTKVFTSGEALPYTLAHQAKHILGANLYNLYGPTEAAIDVTHWEVENRKDNKVPIGRPIANTQLYIVDKDMKQLPIGAPGELLIGGHGLAKCYLNKPELTQEKFIDNPFNASSSSRLYRTGDLARWLDDGNVEFLGRIDNQVKIRGFRIELGEIESATLKHEAVRECAVLVAGQSNTDKFIVAYIVPSQGSAFSSTELKTELAITLPEFMIPSRFIKVDALPLTSNGKLDRKSLPDPRVQSVTVEQPIEPRNEQEHSLAKIWCDILNVDKVGVNENFFELGGNSLTVLSLVSKVQSALPQVSISQVSFYQDPTIQGTLRINVVQTDSGSNTQSVAKGLLTQLVRATKEPELTMVCVPYAGANASVYQPLANELVQLSTDISVLALTNPGNDFGQDTAPMATSFEAIADICAREVLEKTRGNIAIYGHCVGSYLALELTRKLESLGRRPVFFVAAGAFPLPIITRYLPLNDRWKYKTDEDLWDLLQRWGMPQTDISTENQALILRRFRSDAKMALQYEKARVSWKINTPTFSLVSNEDPLTANPQKKYKAWRRCASSVDLVTLEQGNHYFVGSQAPQVAENIVDFSACVGIELRSSNKQKN